MKQVDILISGGGVAGLTAAAAFGSAGFSVLCVDPTPPVTSATDDGADLRTTAFLQPAQGLLEAAGIWAHLAPHGTRLQTMRIVDTGGQTPVSREFEATDIGDGPFGWNLPNWLIRREVLARIAELPSVEFCPGLATQQVITRSSEAIVTLSDATRVTAKMVIAADGRDSPVRDAAGLTVTRKDFGQRALTFAVTHAAPHHNVSTEVHRTGGPCTFVPLPDHEGRPCSAVVWMAPEEEAQSLLSLETPAFEIALAERTDGLFGDLELVSRRTSWPMIAQLVNRLWAQRIAVVAEAAHVVPPIGAQGLNMSLADLQSLLDLAVAAPKDIGSDAMLASYHRARYSDIKARVVGVSMLNRASMATPDVAKRARALGLQALHDVAPLRKMLMKLGMGAARF